MDMSAAALPPIQPRISDADRANPLFPEYQRHRSFCDRQMIDAPRFTDWLYQRDVTTGGSLSVPVTPSEPYKVSTPVPDTITPFYREGELDKRDYAKAVLAELIAAVKEHRQPNPVPEGPYIDWDAAQVGTCS